MTTVTPDVYGIYVVPVAEENSPILLKYMEDGLPIHKDYMRDKHGRTQLSKHLIAVLPVSGEIPTGGRPYIIRQSNHPPENRSKDIMIPLSEVDSTHVAYITGILDKLYEVKIITEPPKVVPSTRLIRIVWPDSTGVEECIHTRIILDGMKWKTGQLIRAIWAHRWSI